MVMLYRELLMIVRNVTVHLTGLVFIVMLE